MTEQNKKLQVLDRDIIKYIAIIPMFIGHFVDYVFCNDTSQLSFILTVLQTSSLIAPPIFFSFIADGYKYTHSRKKYALRLFIFACITQIPFRLANDFDLLSFPKSFNIFFTLFLGLISIIIWESSRKLPLRIVGIVLLDALTLLIGSEWMIFGIPIILGYHIFRDKPKIRFIWFTSMILGMTAFQFMFSGISILYTVLMLVFMELSFFIVTMCCNGKKGRFPTFSKWFFYIFYPAHMFIIWAAKILI